MIPALFLLHIAVHGVDRNGIFVLLVLTVVKVDVVGDGAVDELVLLLQNEMRCQKKDWLLPRVDNEALPNAAPCPVSGFAVS